MYKRIFYLSDYELRVFLAKGKTLTEVQVFQTISGETEFANYLSNDPKTPTYCLVDTTQEEYQVAHMPHVRGKDHRHLMAQKMSRLFKDTPYTYSLVQGREQQGRRDDRVLFMGLNNPTLLQPWLNLIIAHKVPLVGIYSLALLSQQLLKYFPKAPYTLLVAHTPPINSHSPAGLRQSFFVNQKLQFSRLIPLNSLDPVEYAEYISTQIITTRHYLNSAELLPTEAEPLSVVILTDTPFFPALNESLNYESSPFNIHILDNRDFGHQFEGGAVPKKWVLHHFVAFQLSRRWHTTNHYATAADTRYFLYRKVRRAIYVTAVLVFSGAALASSMILENTLVIQQTGLKLADNSAKRLVEFKLLNQKKPNLPFDIRLIRNIVDVGLHLKAHHLSPRPAWEKLSQVLSHHPDLFMEQLQWGIGHFPAEIFQASNQTENFEASAAADLDDFDPSKHFLEGMRLSGKIHPGNYQNALQTFNNFVNDLAKKTDFWLVEVLLAPYDSKQVLQGQIGSPTSEVSNAPFIIDIFLKHSYSNESS